MFDGISVTLYKFPHTFLRENFSEHHERYNFSYDIFSKCVKIVWGTFQNLYESWTKLKYCWYSKVDKVHFSGYTQGKTYNSTEFCILNVVYRILYTEFCILIFLYRMETWRHKHSTYAEKIDPASHKSLFLISVTYDAKISPYIKILVIPISKNIYIYVNKFSLKMPSLKMHWSYNVILCPAKAFIVEISLHNCMWMVIIIKIWEQMLSECSYIEHKTKDKSLDCYQQSWLWTWQAENH